MPVTVLLADYGQHSSLLLPLSQSADSTILRYEEFAFGDFDFMALNRDHWYNAVAAILWSSGSALGHRTVDVPINPALESWTIGCQRVLQIPVNRSDADALRQSLGLRYARHFRTQVFNPQTRLYLVRDDEHYVLTNNCNHASAGWLRTLGCKVDGSACFSSFQLAGNSR